VILATKKPSPTRRASSTKPATARTSAAKKTASTSKRAAAKKPPAKTPAATSKRKTATAKKPAAKRSSAKTTAAKKPAAKKPAAKKPAPKTAAAKKPMASKSTARRKSSSGTASASAASSPARSTARAKVPFKVGDKVVYPHHGAATIVKKERHEFDGENHDYFVLEVATDQLVVRVPTTKAVELGVRPVISKTVARKVFATFKEDPQEAGSNWSRWYKLLTEKINSGDIFQVAEVVRDLTYAQQVKGISPALKRMLAKARLIIVSELRFALNLEEEEAIKRLDRALPKVEEPLEA
jgi:CarD family transcriptional regulator